MEHTRLTIGLLETRARTAAAKLLRLTPTRVRNNERPIIGHKNILDLLFRCLVDELLIICHDSLGDGLAHGIDLPGETTTLHANADVNLLELVPEQKHRFIDLHAEDVRLHCVDRAAVDTHLACPGAHQGNRDGMLLPEALDLLCLGVLGHAALRGVSYGGAPC